MKLIAHRGNVYGPNSDRENTLTYIQEALDEGFDVEIDIRYHSVIGSQFVLGHDDTIIEDPPKCVETIQWSFLFKYSTYLWVHAKDIATAFFLSKNKRIFKDLNWFFHEHDQIAITSQGHLWTYPIIKELTPLSVMLNFEYGKYGKVMFMKTPDIDCFGLCSDYVGLIEVVKWT